jgi:hypothetical protein
MVGLASVDAPITGTVPADPITVVLSGIGRTPRMDAMLSHPSLLSRAFVRLEPACTPPCAANLWRLETCWGTPLNARDVLRQAWHNPPYALTIRLVQYEGGSTGPVILDEGTIGTRQSWAALNDAVERLALRFVSDAVDGRSRGVSSVMPAVAAAPATMPGWVRDQASRWKTRLMDEWWSLGVTAAPLADVLDGTGVDGAGRLGTVNWFQPKPGPTYLADPFPWPGTGQILCEEMPRDGTPGRIVAVSDNAGRLNRGAVVLDDGDHHSYPSTIGDGGHIYCVPESVGRGATRIYELEADGRLTPVCSPAPDKRLADPTLFRRAGRVWLACTDLDAGGHDNLCLMYATTIHGPWLPHAKWPVRIDVRGARPAGAPFHYNGRLIRPGQDCAATYGAAVALHEVEELTETTFRESLITVLRPDPAGPFPDGLHTLVHDGTRFWLDGKRFIFDPSVLGRKALHRLRRLGVNRIP